MAAISAKDIKIMVVDDEVDLEPLILQRFRRHIRNEEYDFVFAHNGLEALSRLLEYPEIGVILSDINMPEMDGLTLLLRLKELQNPSLKTVIVSAYGDMDNIRTAMNRGAFDFVTKPINFDDLEITINKTLEEIAAVRNSLKEHEQLVTIQQDLKIASEIQQSILPKVFPPFPDRKEFDLHAAMIAAQEIGGDFYDYFLVDDNHLAFVIGDVSGKGIPAAIFMAVSRTFIRVMGHRGSTAMDCMYYVNNLLCNDNSSCMFVTVFYGILNIATGELEYVNAGHNPPYIMKGDGSVKELFVTRNSVLGCFEDYSFKPDSYKLEKGDLLYLYTDGVTEAFDAKEEAFGTQRLEEDLSLLANSTPREVVNTVNEKLKQFAAGVRQSDDITMLVLKYF
jgi:sigma-B regulation protein RsbU (phosphoserine phosphatase)